MVAVELNPEACFYLKENIALNRVIDKIKVIEGDARVETSKLGVFDRILMPLPKDAGDFLDVALPALKNRGIIHFYHFAYSPKDSAEFVKRKVEELGYKVKIITAIRCGSYSPTLTRNCVDFQVFKDYDTAYEYKDNSQPQEEENNIQWAKKSWS